jgi:beta-glucosidase/6-phospho-beta-glucosidase/beta-galactosidase
LTAAGQKNKRTNTNLIYVDKQGVIRFTKTKGEASFFGVNYTVPFAYGYRSVKRTGIDIEKAIDQDVYHLARLGLDAFRVHVWDWEITDSLGNLLENEHLRLFDYLLARLKERNIKILVTPIAFWGNGYPEKDEKTGSFSSVYGKGPSVVNENAIIAQERYMQQFFKHINPYTTLSYTNDPDVIAMEINNEPKHSGPKERTTEYVNRLAAAVRSTGWTKPVFYNISESPTYADAVAKSN